MAFSVISTDINYVPVGAPLILLEVDVKPVSGYVLLPSHIVPRDGTLVGWVFMSASPSTPLQLDIWRPIGTTTYVLIHTSSIQTSVDVGYNMIHIENKHRTVVKAGDLLGVKADYTTLEIRTGDCEFMNAAVLGDLDLNHGDIGHTFIFPSPNRCLDLGVQAEITDTGDFFSYIFYEHFFIY